MSKYLIKVVERAILVAEWTVKAKNKEEAESKYYNGHCSLESREVREREHLEIISICSVK